MKRNKKLTMIIGITAMVVALAIAISAFLVYDNYIADTVISIDEQTVLAGDSISVPIKIDRNHGMYVGQIVLKYDPNSFEYLSVANGGVFDACVAEGNEHPGLVYIIVQQLGIDNTDKDGVIATLNFKVKNSAVKGENTMTLLKPENIEDGTYFMRVQDAMTGAQATTNEEENWIVPECKNGIIIVK